MLDSDIDSSGRFSFHEFEGMYERVILESAFMQLNQELV